MKQLGKLEKIEDIRSIWKHEAKDFTPTIDNSDVDAKAQKQLESKYRGEVTPVPLLSIVKAKGKYGGGALNCISEVAQGKEKIEVLIERFEENDEVRTWCSENKRLPIDVLKILFDYSVIGCINDRGRWIFKYKDDYFEFMPSYLYYCVHYGFCRKLRIPKSYDRTIIEVIRRYN